MPVCGAFAGVGVRLPVCGAFAGVGVRLPVWGAFAGGGAFAGKNKCTYKYTYKYPEYL